MRVLLEMVINWLVEMLINWIVNLHPELGNIFLCINVQDFLDSMVICIFRYKMNYYAFDDNIY